jgi:hypothetical protein
MALLSLEIVPINIRNVSCRIANRWRRGGRLERQEHEDKKGRDLHFYSPLCCSSLATKAVQPV